MERNLLRTLQNCRNLSQLRKTHLQILVHGLGESNLLISKLIDASSAFRCPNYAVEIFRNCPAPDVTTHNFLIKCLNGEKCLREAFSTYNQMRVLGLWPNSYTFTFVMRSSELSGCLENGKKVHAQVVRCGFGSHVFVLNSLLDLYSKFCEDLSLARKLFDSMTAKDVVSWNSMINAFMARGDRYSAMDLFDMMPERNVVSWNSIITGLLKAGDMDLARSVFDRMAMKNEVSWNAMITGYVTWGHMAAAQAIFDRMENKTVVSWAAMISGYAKVGDLESFCRLFHLMPVKNVVSWNIVISAYNHNSRFDLALETFHQMLVDGKFMPNEVTLISVVSACAQLGASEHGNWVHSYIKKNSVHITIPLGNALIDMFAKCGDVKTSESVFRQMTRRCVITWTTMISGLGLNGKCMEALSIFEEMCIEGTKPDDVAFVAVLTACTHGGLVEEGHQIFDRMVGEFGIKPSAKHYGCIVDLLGRAGKLEEAIQFIETMSVVPEAITWAALLSSCKTYRKNELVDYVSRKISELDPLDSGYRVLVSNSQASVGWWQEVANTRHAMRWDGLEKVPGCSSIQVGNKVHEFLVKDSRHKMRKEIYDVLDRLTALLRQVTYEPIIWET